MHTLTNLKTTEVSHESNRNAHTHKPKNNKCQMKATEMHTLTNLKTTEVSHENKRNAHTHKHKNNRSVTWKQQKCTHSQT